MRIINQSTCAKHALRSKKKKKMTNTYEVVLQLYQNSPQPRVQYSRLHCMLSLDRQLKNLILRSNAKLSSQLGLEGEITWQFPGTS